MPAAVRAGVNEAGHEGTFPSAATETPMTTIFQRKDRVLAATLFLTSLGSASSAFGQAASPAGGLGAQLNAMSGEAINAGGQFGGMAMYVAALVCFIGGVWALWQSRHPQNRETGRVAMGLAGLVLCGLFATGGVWINKAAVSASGGNATINDAPAMVQFGTGG